MSQKESEDNVGVANGVSDGYVNLNGGSVRTESERSDGIRVRVTDAVIPETNFVVNALSENLNESYRSVSKEASIGYGFHVGDMVWGKVKSHPWWPGHIYDEALASPSVRTTKHYGHVLVAFFGDSSYGWFDPAELIPFDPHFTDKSRQTNTRSFLKAVEEAVDEASRRSSMGVVCRCRNPCNFRSSSVDGLVEVDVPDYETGGMYSWNQIEKARERLQPSGVLSFVKSLAVISHMRGNWSIEWIKDRAAVFAYRKAVFEEFDETYAQAFGMHYAKSPDRKPCVYNQSPKGPSRAPLSGPLVFAETLGSVKGMTKTKTKDYSKRDRYILKRRDETEGLNSEKSGRNLTASAQTAYIDGPSVIGSEDFILQRRTQNPPINQEAVTESNEETAMAEAEIKASEPNESTPLTKSQESTDYEYQEEPKDVLNTVLSKTKKSRLPKHPKGEMGITEKPIGEKKRGRKKKVSLTEVAVDEQPGKSSVFDLVDTGEKQAGITEKTMGEKKRRRRKKVSGSEIERAEKSTGSDQAEEPVISILPIRLEGVNLQGLISNLQELAVSHFFDTEQEYITKHCFLRFRSVVYQKSLVTPRPPEGESIDLHEPKSEGDVAERPEPPPLPRPQRPQIRLDDPTRGGQKRLQSERLEEIAAKRIKRISEIKSEKKMVLKPQEVRKVEPTMLLMNFSPSTSMPSVPELKARFARFGPLDHSATRVFWRTYSCQIVFMYKADAQVAYNHAVGNSALYGDVKYYLKEMASDATEPTVTATATPMKAALSPHQHAGQLKSCLKKSTNDEGGNVRLGGQRVKFVLGGEGGGGGDFEGRNVGMTPPTPPTPPYDQFVNGASVPRREDGAAIVDVSQQMLSLLTRCHDVVTHVKATLGHLPYRAL